MARALEPDAEERHRTVPLRDTFNYVPGYPRKLVIFKIPASSYWWVRYYAAEKIYKRTTKTDIKRDALEAAKRFYDDINHRLKNGAEPLMPWTNPAEVMTFARMTTLLMESESAKFQRGQLTEISLDNMQYRFNKLILPFFGVRDVLSITYPVLEEYLQFLSKQPGSLSVSTISAYMGLVRKVLLHAARHSFLNSIPEFPKVGVEDKPRGWFQVGEYHALHKAAKKLAGSKVEWRKHSAPETGTYLCMPGMRLEGEDALIRRIEMTKDLADLIVFMVNSYIRPTDIKNMQHQHVDVIKNDERQYLRLRLPPSKGHSYPITTMPWAVRVYERICERRIKEGGLGFAIMPNDYVFLPQIENRGYALKQLQRQFDAVLEFTGLSAKGEDSDRTLYSLRHSSIMFRLMFGSSIDTLTLARNARTSPEMIDRFYAAPLQGEMNIDKLQGKRNPRPWEHSGKPNRPLDTDALDDQPADIDAPQLEPDMGARMLEVVSKRDPKLVKFVAPAVKPAAKPPAEPPSDYELMLEAFLNPGTRVNG